MIPRMIEWNETRTCTLRNALFWLFLMLATHIVFKYTGMYWIVREIDIIPHFLGGMSLSFIFIWIASLDYAQKAKLSTILIGIILFVLISAIVFEVAQYIYNIYYPYKLGTLSDTVSDVLVGFVGGLAGCGWWYKFCIYRIRPTL